MKKSILIFSCTFFIFLLVSCNEDIVHNNNSSDNSFTYPYNTNSLWYYTTRNFITNIRPDSISRYFETDTSIGYGAATFTKDTIINNDTLKILTNSHSGGGHGHSTSEIFKQTDSGLIRIAFYSDGVNFGPTTPQTNSLSYLINNKNFNSLNEIFFYYKNDFKIDNSNDSLLIFDVPPVTAVKYPIVTNTEWILRRDGSTTFKKKYLDFETVNVQSGSHYCVKIQKVWYMNNSSIPEANLIFYDYFAKEGMIKRDFLIKDIEITNTSGNTIGYVDAKEEAELNIYVLP